MRKQLKNKKEIKYRSEKKCSICGKNMHIIHYTDHSYRGGHHFGRILLHRKKDLKKATEAGTRKVRMNGITFNVLKKDPKSYKHIEYWECPKCYWR